MKIETAAASAVAIKSGVTTASLAAIITLFESDIHYLISFLLGMIAAVLVLLKKYKEMRSKNPPHSGFDYLSITIEKIIVVICVVGIVVFGGVVVLDQYIQLPQAVLYFLSVIIGYYHEEIFKPLRKYINERWNV